MPPHHLAAMRFNPLEPTDRTVGSRAKWHTKDTKAANNHSIIQQFDPTRQRFSRWTATFSPSRQIWPSAARQWKRRKRHTHSNVAPVVSLSRDPARNMQDHPAGRGGGWEGCAEEGGKGGKRSDATVRGETVKEGEALAGGAGGDVGGASPSDASDPISRAHLQQVTHLIPRLIRPLLPTSVTQTG